MPTGWRVSQAAYRRRVARRARPGLPGLLCAGTPLSDYRKRVQMIFTKVVVSTTSQRQFYGKALDSFSSTLFSVNLVGQVEQVRGGVLRVVSEGRFTVTRTPDDRDGLPIDFWLLQESLRAAGDPDVKIWGGSGFVSKK